MSSKVFALYVWCLLERSDFLQNLLFAFKRLPWTEYCPARAALWYTSAWDPSLESIKRAWPRSRGFPCCGRSPGCGSRGSKSRDFKRVPRPQISRRGDNIRRRCTPYPPLTVFQISLKSIQPSRSGSRLKFTIQMIGKCKIYAVFRLSIDEFCSLGSENLIECVSYGLLRVCQRTSKNIQDPLRYSVFKVPKTGFSRPKND